MIQKKSRVRSCRITTVHSINPLFWVGPFLLWARSLSPPKTTWTETKPNSKPHNRKQGPPMD